MGETQSYKEAVSTGNTAQYREAMTAMLEGRDPVELMAGAIDKLEAAIGGLSDEQLRRREAEGKWSVMEVLQHLADAEMVIGYRIRLILSEDLPEIKGFDQDKWAENLRYNEADPQVALAQMRGLRQANLALIRNLTPKQLQRFGEHNERGRESVQDTINLYAAHDLAHLRQIERIKKAIGAA